MFTSRSCIKSVIACYFPYSSDCGGISEAESNILISFLSGCDFNLCYSISELKCNETGMNIFLPDLKLNYRTITLA